MGFYSCKMHHSGIEVDSKFEDSRKLKITDFLPSPPRAGGARCIIFGEKSQFFEGKYLKAFWVLSGIFALFLQRTWSVLGALSVRFWCSLGSIFSLGDQF